MNERGIEGVMEIPNKDNDIRVLVSGLLKLVILIELLMTFEMHLCKKSISASAPRVLGTNSELICTIFVALTRTWFVLSIMMAQSRTSCGYKESKEITYVYSLDKQ